ncbi:MAG: M6 family metalloprotease domain-containing protein [Bacteroidales bacterium]|jgi:M6 family metalloprotease-like protein|nr:M6 family metalloprotease domain-containing protein [Bacteroidales bacterium]
MKKIFILTASVLFIVADIYARPAKPAPIEVIEPDGTKITIILKGDERIKWAETSDGYSLLRNGDGFFEYAIQNENGEMVSSGIKVASKTKTLPAAKKHLLFSKSQRENILASDNCPKYARAVKQTENVNHKMPVILVSFKDRACIFSKDDFDTILNVQGLNKPPYTGSIADYFYDNSRGTFQFTSDVFGPYTLANNMSYYGGNDSYGNDKNPRAMVREAIQKAYDDGCDFSQYDADGDGYVDGVHIFFAGMGEEASGEANAIWSHEWQLSTPITYNGKKVLIYSCSPELNDPGILTSIGAPAHEMGHAIGLPDFYDTDYEESGGIAVTPGDYDVMDMGSYNNNGYTPPLHNAWSRMFLGWLERTPLTEPMSMKMLPAEQATKCYIVETQTANEYFVLDNRPRSKWDIWNNLTPRLGGGLLVFAIDSNNGNWGNNELNCNPAKRSFYIKQANGGNNSTSRMGVGTPFPGSTNKTAFTDSTSPNARSKNGVNTEKPITNIIIDEENNVLFDFMGGGAPEPPTAIEKQQQASTIVVFPNPAKDKITIKSEAQIQEVVLFNLMGKRVRKSNNNEISVRELPEGTYLLQVKTATEVIARKIIVI